MRITLVAAIPVCLALGLSACGADDKSAAERGVSLGDQPSRSDYIERADQICQELYEQRDPLEVDAAEAAQQNDGDRGADVLDNAADITDRRLDEIEALPAPEGDEQRVEAIVAAGRNVADSARDAADAIRDDDVKALARDGARGQAATRRFNKLSIEYGFLVCGRGQAETIG